MSQTIIIDNNSGGDAGVEVLSDNVHEVSRFLRGRSLGKCLERLEVGDPQAA